MIIQASVISIIHFSKLFHYIREGLKKSDIYHSGGEVNKGQLTLFIFLFGPWQTLSVLGFSKGKIPFFSKVLKNG